MADDQITILLAPRQAQEKYRPVKQCAYDGCDSWVWARGYCGAHYQQMKREGQLRNVVVKGDTRRRFYESFEVNPETLCWEWKRFITSNGYGCITIGEKGKKRAHRYSYELFYGPIPDGLSVLHRCDNKICCNIEHLFTGTGKDNMQDCVKKGRHAGQTGANRAKITDAMAMNIRIMYARGQHSMSVLATIYGVQQNTLASIVKGEAHLV